MTAPTSAYINGDSGYLWLTCGTCEDPLIEVEAGTSLAELNAAVALHGSHQPGAEHGPGAYPHAYTDGCGGWCNNRACPAGNDHDRCNLDCVLPTP